MLVSLLVDRRLDHRPATARTWPTARERDPRARVRCWAARVRARARCSGPLGWAEPEKEERVGPS
jgi:hypothetical protein